MASMACQVEILPPLPRRRRTIAAAYGSEYAAGLFVPPLVPAEPSRRPARASAATEDDDHGLGTLLTEREAASVAAAAAAAEAAAAERAEAGDGGDEEGEEMEMEAPPAHIVAAAAASAAAGAFEAALALAAAALDTSPSPPDASPEPSLPAPSPSPSPSDDAPPLAPEAAAADFLAEEAPLARQHVFITSPPGVGKTTMVQRLLHMMREEEGPSAVDLAGFYTEEVRDSRSQRCGFDVVRPGDLGKRDINPRAPLARLGTHQPKVGKYTVDVPSFEGFALPALATLPRAPPLPENPQLHTALSGALEAVTLVREAEVPGLRKEGDEDDDEWEEEENIPAPPKKKSQAEKNREPFLEAPAFLGAKPGYFFTLGVVGLGYYLDRPFGSWMPDDVEPEVDEEEEEVKYCLIYRPSTGEQEWVLPETLEPIPSGWKHPLRKQAEARRLRPRLVVCDEVGKMALLSIKFPAALMASLDDEGHVFLGTLPQANKGQRDVEVVDKVKKRKDVHLIRLTRNNRDELLTKAYATLRESLGYGPPGSKSGPRKSDEELVAEQKAEEEVAKGRVEAEAKRLLERKKEKEKLKKARELAKKKEAHAQQAREKRKKRADIRERARAVLAASKAGPLEVEEGEEEDDVEALAPEVELGDSDDDSDLEAFDGGNGPTPSPSPRPSPSPIVAELDDEDIDVVAEMIKKPLLKRPPPRPKAGLPLGVARPGSNGARTRISRAGGAVLSLDEDEVL